MKNVFCQSCGSKSPSPSANFCVGCGAPLKPNVKARATEVIEEDESDETPDLDSLKGSIQVEPIYQEEFRKPIESLLRTAPSTDFGVRNVSKRTKKEKKEALNRFIQFIQPGKVDVSQE